jgi:hypothetical protein
MNRRDAEERNDSVNVVTRRRRAALNTRAMNEKKNVSTSSQKGIATIDHVGCDKTEICFAMRSVCKRAIRPINQIRD